MSTRGPSSSFYFSGLQTPLPRFREELVREPPNETPQGRENLLQTTFSISSISSIYGPYPKPYFSGGVYNKGKIN